MLSWMRNCNMLENLFIHFHACCFSGKDRKGSRPKRNQNTSWLIAISGNSTWLIAISDNSTWSIPRFYQAKQGWRCSGRKSIQLLLRWHLSWFFMDVASRTCLTKLSWDLLDTWLNQHNWDLLNWKRSDLIFYMNFTAAPLVMNCHILKASQKSYFCHLYLR